VYQDGGRTNLGASGVEDPFGMMMTIPNLITGLRIILVPIFVIYLIHERFLCALVVFLLAGLSDGVDGLIARMFNQKSKLGSFLDPLADKILLVATFVVLAVKGLIPSWLTVIVISRDTLILLGVLILFLNGANFKISPSILSKMTTCLQLITIFVVLCKLHFAFPFPYTRHLFWLTAIFTVASGLHYMHYWFVTIGEGSLGDGG
jgi:cardiolipin synthase